LLLLGFVPVELLRHNVDYLRKGLESGFRVEEGETGSTSDNVDGGGSVFSSNSPGDFGIDVRVDWVDSLSVNGESESSLRSHRADSPSAITVSLGKVTCDIGLRKKTRINIDTSIRRGSRKVNSPRDRIVE